MSAWLCEDCQYVEEASRKREWWRWRCLKSPKPMPRQFVVADPFLTEPPFERCRDINHDGHCDLFESVPQGEDDAAQSYD